MLSVPIGGQFEQVLNALYLEKLNYGRYAKTLDEETLARFLDAIPSCAESLKGYSQNGNVELLQKLDALLIEAAEKRGDWQENTVT